MEISRSPSRNTDGVGTKWTNKIRQGVGLYYANRYRWLRSCAKNDSASSQTTGVSTKKQLEVCAMYVDEQDLTPVTRYLDIFQAPDAGAKRTVRRNSEGLWKEVDTSYQHYRLLVSYMQCVMFGENQSISTLLKEGVPYVPNVAAIWSIFVQLMPV